MLGHVQTRNTAGAAPDENLGSTNISHETKAHFDRPETRGAID
jgi:hypothetical protein